MSDFWLFFCAFGYNRELCVSEILIETYLQKTQYDCDPSVWKKGHTLLAKWPVWFPMGPFVACLSGVIVLCGPECGLWFCGLWWEGVAGVHGIWVSVLKMILKFSGDEAWVAGVGVAAKWCDVVGLAPDTGVVSCCNCASDGELSQGLSLNPWVDKGRLKATWWLGVFGGPKGSLLVVADGCLEFQLGVGGGAGWWRCFKGVAGGSVGAVEVEAFIWVDLCVLQLGVCCCTIHDSAQESLKIMINSQPLTNFM